MTESERSAYIHFALFGYKCVEALSGYARAKAFRPWLTKFFNRRMDLLEELSVWFGSLESHYIDEFKNFEPADFWADYRVICERYPEERLQDLREIFDDLMSSHTEQANKAKQAGTR